MNERASGRGKSSNPSKKSKTVEIEALHYEYLSEKIDGLTDLIRTMAESQKSYFEFQIRTEERNVLAEERLAGIMDKLIARDAIDDHRHKILIEVTTRSKTNESKINWLWIILSFNILTIIGMLYK